MDIFPGVKHVVYWDSATDGVGISGDEDATIRITASDASNPSGGSSGDKTFTVNNIVLNTPPTVTVTTPTGEQTRHIQIYYTLYDNESDNCSVTIVYSLDNGSTWDYATQSIIGDSTSFLDSSPTGEEYMFSWDSRADSVAKISIETVIVKIIPNDFNIGNSTETDLFTLNNTYINQSPTVEIISGPAQDSTINSTTVTFEWSGADIDGYITAYYYSLDSTNLNVMTTDLSVVLSGLEGGERCFRVVAIDNAGYLSESVTRTFICNPYISGGGIIPSTKKPSGTHQAVTAGLDYINEVSNWEDATTYSPPQGPLVLASFCGLALLASGSGFAGEYGNTVNSAADYVYQSILDPNTLSPSWDQTNWNLAIGRVFLAEAFASSGDLKYKNKAAEVCTLLELNMESSDGYGHGPAADPNPLGYTELSIVSSWVVMCIGACEDIGVEVNPSFKSKAIGYLKTCDSIATGGVMYSHVNNDVSVHRTGAAIMAYKMAGIDDDVTESWTDYIETNWNTIPNGHGSPIMGYLTSALGCLCAGQSLWDNFVESYFYRMLGYQQADGSWVQYDGDGSSETLGGYYMTAVNCLVLQLDLGNLFYFKN